VLVNLTGTKDVSMSVKMIKDGTYVDRVSGEQFVVENRVLKGKIASEDGIAVIYSTDTVQYARVSIQGGTFTGDSATVTITLENAVKGTYQLDNGEKISFTGSAEVLIGEGIDYGKSTLDECAVFEGGSRTDTIPILFSVFHLKGFFLQK
jgi:alpha-amylase